MKKITLAGAVIVCSIALCACGRNAKKLNNTGIEYYNAEQYDKAVKAFEEAVDKDKDGKAEYNVNLGKAYVELGNCVNGFFFNSISIFIFAGCDCSLL